MDLNKIGSLVKQYMLFILAAIVILGLIWGIMNLTGSYEVTGKISAAGESETEDLELDEIYDNRDEDGDIGAMYTKVWLANMIAGIGMLGAAGLAGWGAYEMYQKKGDGRKQFGWAGLAGAAASLVQIILYFTASVSEEMFGTKLKMSIGTPLFAWICLILFAAVVALDKVVLVEKAPVQPVPPAAE